jgi:hypothetical protein
MLRRRGACAGAGGDLIARLDQDGTRLAVDGRVLCLQIQACRFCRRQARYAARASSASCGDCLLREQTGNQSAFAFADAREARAFHTSRDKGGIDLKQQIAGVNDLAFREYASATAPLPSTARMRSPELCRSYARQ